MKTTKPSRPRPKAIEELITVMGMQVTKHQQAAHRLEKEMNDLIEAYFDKPSKDPKPIYNHTFLRLSNKIPPTHE